MSTYPSHVWDQLKNKTIQEIRQALAREGWELARSRGSIQTWVKDTGNNTRHVSLHIHPHKTMGAKLLKRILDDIDWNENDFRRLKLIR